MVLKEKILCNIWNVHSQLDEVNQEFLARMNASAKIHLTPSKVKEKYVIRFVALQENCNKTQIENAWKIIQEFATKISEETTTETEHKKQLDEKHSQRFSYTREVSKDIFDRQSSM